MAVRSNQKLEYFDLGNANGNNVVEIRFNGDAIAHG